MRLGLAAAIDERPGRPLPKVWPCGQCCQVMYNDVPTRHTKVGDIGGGQGSEVHRVGRLV